VTSGGPLDRAAPPDRATAPGSATAPAGDGARAAGGAIVVRGLRKQYDRRAVVQGIDLDVPAGSITALLGPNGAGKTTTVEILEGYRQRDGGEVRVLGLDPERDGAALRARIGLMLQGGGIYPQARPREILRLYARFYRDPMDPDALLEQVGLADVAGTRYRVLSGGQRQRLGLALALVGRPELVLLDEPTAGMDPAAKASTRDLIVGLRGAGVTVLLTTHELLDVELLADRIAIIDHGRIVAAGTVAELAAGASPRLRFRIGATLEGADRVELASLLGGTLREDGAVGRYLVEGSDPTPAAVGTLATWFAARGLLVAELRTTGATLEERYLELTGGRATGDAGDAA
jgi:ABC-2 type transport system ATP-binding protein